MGSKLKRIIFRLDALTANQLKKYSLEHGMQQSKLIKDWLESDSDGYLIYRSKNLLKLTKNITFHITDDLLTKINKKAKLANITRSHYIYSVIYTSLNKQVNTQPNNLSLSRFDLFFNHGKYKQLVELIQDKIDLLNQSQIIDYAMALVFLGKNDRAYQIINDFKSRTNYRSFTDLHTHAKLLILQSRLTRGISSAHSSAHFANEALNVGLTLNNNNIVSQALLRLASGYLGKDDFTKALECLDKVKNINSKSYNALILVNTYILEAYVYLYMLDFKKVLELTLKGKAILDNYPHDFYRVELLYLELRAKYFIDKNQNNWMSILSELIALINITGSETQKISTYNTSGAFFLKNNNENLGLSYIQKAIKLENIYFNFDYCKSSYSNVLYLYLSAKHDLNSFIKIIDNFILSRRLTNDGYLSYKYLKESAQLLYSKDRSARFSAIKQLEDLKSNTNHPAIALAANTTLLEKSTLFIR